MSIAYLDRSADIRGAHRLSLTRIWDKSLDMVLICGLNPSMADERKDDATIRKEVGFCKRLGFGGFVKVNVFTYRATDTKDLVRAFRRGEATSHWPGPGHYATENAGVIAVQTSLLQQYNGAWRPLIIAAWGNLPIRAMEGPAQSMARFLLALGSLHCFGWTKQGHPRHPVRLPYATKLESWTYD